MLEPQKLKNNLQFVYGALGQPAFIKKGATSLAYSIDPKDWTPSQLETILNFMKKNPNCSLCDDGSGTTLLEKDKQFYRRLKINRILND